MNSEEQKSKHAAYMRKWLKTTTGAAYLEKQKSYHVAYQRNWCLKNNQKRRLTNRLSYAKHRDERLAYCAEYMVKYPLKRKAQWNVFLAIKKGVLIRPSICSKCGAKRTIEAHHHKGYEKEFWLDVIWLCISCHRKEDKRK